ncbi:hypothetical protein CHUAL_004657 [Chamberlinius hualienensis]
MSDTSDVIAPSHQPETQPNKLEEPSEPETVICRFLPPNGDFLDSILLSVWGNIVGPEAIFTWKRKDVASTDSERLRKSVKYAVSHTLHGELGKSDSCLVRKARGHELYLIEDEGFIVCSVPFSASCNKRRPNVSITQYLSQQYAANLLPHSLALIISGFQIQRFKDLQPLIQLYMQRFACCVRAFLHKEDYNMTVYELTPIVEQFCSNLASFYRSQSDSLTTMKELHLHSDIDGQFGRFLTLVVTSHLQTCGCTVVIGDSAEEINTMIATINHFLQPKERSRVRFASKSDPLPYHPGILIQGIIKNITSEVNISTEDVLCNVLPTTIVDMSQKQVLRSWLLHEHVKQRQIQFKKDLIAILCGHKPCSSHTESVFKRVGEISPLVKDFITKIWAMESDLSLRKNLTTIFCRQLEYHALALIKQVNANYHREPSPNDCPRQVDKKKLMKQLDLIDEADFLVVLATAEKLQQGIYHIVMNADS